MSISTFDGDTLGTDTIVVVRANPGAVEDAYGNPVPGDPIRISIPGCSVQPFVARNTSETLTPVEDLVVSKWRLFAPYGSDIRPSDEIDFGDLKLQVDGDLMPWTGDQYDDDAYCETYLKRWGG